MRADGGALKVWKPRPMWPASAAPNRLIGRGWLKLRAARSTIKRPAVPRAAGARSGAGEAPGVVEDPGEPAGRGLHEPCFPQTVDR